jgi:hypothetical protein
MNYEFRRLQKLAGIREMKIRNPTKIDPRTLKIGDQLRVVKEAYPVRDPDNPRAPRIAYCSTREECARRNNLPIDYIHSFADIGDIFIVDEIYPGVGVTLFCPETGDDIGPKSSLKLIEFGAFEYV